MNYKKKVEKALEIVKKLGFKKMSDSTSCNMYHRKANKKSQDFFIRDSEHLHLRFDGVPIEFSCRSHELDIEVFQKYINEYATPAPIELTLKEKVFSKYKTTMFRINVKTMLVFKGVNSNLYLCLEKSMEGFSEALEFPHIKTLEQFEQLYLSLTGKELGGE